MVVYRNEYYFGGGIQSSPAGTTPYGRPLRTVELGVTHIPHEVFVCVKLRGRGRNFPSPKRLGVNIKSCWRGFFPIFLKNKD